MIVFDYVYDKFVENLKSFSEALPPDERFTVYPDYFRNVMPANEGSHVFVYLGGFNPSSTSEAGSKDYYQYEAEYVFDLLTVAKASFHRPTNVMTEADRIAGVRLRKLLSGVLHCIYSYRNIQLGLDEGVVDLPSFARMEPFFPQEPNPGEKAAIGLRLTVPVQQVFVPETDPGETLEQLSVEVSGSNGYPIQLEY